MQFVFQPFGQNTDVGRDGLFRYGMVGLLHQQGCCLPEFGRFVYGEQGVALRGCHGALPAQVGEETGGFIDFKTQREYLLSQ